MSTIIVEKECGCFRKSIYENNKSFESKDEALLQAGMMVKHMNTKFCQKHNFQAREDGENIVISVEMATAQSSGCCGGGHCS
jgi:hypothetical protein